MAKIKISVLAEKTRKPVDEILEKVREAGLKYDSAADTLSDEEYKSFLRYLRGQRKTADSGQPEAADAPGEVVAQDGRRISVEIRKSAAAAGGLVDDLEQRRQQGEESRKKQLEAHARKQQEKSAAKKQDGEKAAVPAPATEAARTTKKAPTTRRYRKDEDVEETTAAKNKRRRGGRLSPEELGRGEAWRVVEKLLNETGEEEKTAAGAPRRQGIPLVRKAEQRQQAFQKPTRKTVRRVELGEQIDVATLAVRMSVKKDQVIQELAKLGVEIEDEQERVDRDTAALVAGELGHKVAYQEEQTATAREQAIRAIEGADKPRLPVVAVMGHVDHGKTSLLDCIRKTRRAGEEAGGITQHIGAWRVGTEHGDVVFIDTPGHAAFSAMRARGAQGADVVVLVVAADDGVMPQTREASEHARLAGASLVVAVNKVDLEGADAEKVYQELASIDVLTEKWGGDVQCAEVSAKSGTGIDELLQAILLTAEMLELRAPLDVPAQGVVLEASVDRGRGVLCSLLVQRGILRKGNVLLAGDFYGKVRSMHDEDGKSLSAAGPSTPVEVVALRGLPEAGTPFLVTENEKQAREIVTLREREQKTATPAADDAPQRDAEEVFALAASQENGQGRELKLIIKADTRGSLEAITAAVQGLGQEETPVRVLSGGVGGITDSDVSIAATTGACLLGFNVRSSAAVRKQAEALSVKLLYFSVIYELLEDVQEMLKETVVPEARENILGIAEVRDVFSSKRFRKVAGCMVTEGTVRRNNPVRVLRDNVVIFEGELDSLRRFQENVSEVRNGTECGIGVKNYEDIRPGDSIEVFERVQPGNPAQSAGQA